MTLPQRDRFPRHARQGVSAPARLRAAATGFLETWRRPRPESETTLRHAEAALVLVIIVAIVALGWVGDARATLWARSLDPSVVAIFQRITKLGDSGYIFASAILLIVASVLMQGRGRGRRMDVALGRMAGRATFVLGVNAVAGLASLLLKSLFGRARPRFFDMVGPFHFDAFVINSGYSSFPSGHSITAFGTCMALGYFLPRWRWPLLALALTVGISRIIVGAHYPSDVLAGAAIGIGSAILLRRAFLRRGLVFRHSSRGPVARGRRGLAIRPDRLAEPARPSPMLTLTPMTEAHPPPHVSVVVPVRNEAGNVAPLIQEIELALAAHAPFEIVYVNDGSTDTTAEELQRLMAQKPWLRQIRHATSCGQSAAVRSGVRAARAPVVITLDGDGQNNPVFMPDFLARLAAEGAACGLVQGQRLGRKDTGFKRFQSRIANSVRARILNDATRDTGCGFKCFRRDVYLALPYFDALHRFMPALVRREGYQIAFVDVVDRPRLTGVSNYGFFDRLWVGIVDLAGVRWLISRRRRIPAASEVERP